MKRFLFDTGIAGGYLNRRHGIYERSREEVLRGNRIGICVPVLGELCVGVENSASRERNLARLRHVLSDWILWPYDQVAAQEYGGLATELRRIGRPMQQIDIQIAAIAMPLGKCVVVSSDSDLAAVPGLDVENWAVG